MSKKFIFQIALAGLAIAALTASGLRADIIETKDGARIVGKITAIGAGKIHVATVYAGELDIKQSEVTSIATDRPLSVRLTTGTRLDGRITPNQGQLQIVGPDGTARTGVAGIDASWPVGDMDPALAALQRHWKYEATVDINGTSGNKTQLGTALSFSATLTTPQDTLQYATAYDRQVANGLKSADQFKASVDYANNISDTSTWFARDVAGFDRIMDVTFYDTAAIGVGHDFIKNTVDVLTGRVGLAYRYTGYSVSSTPNVNSAAADFEIAHDLKTKTWELVNKLTFVPAFSQFSNYIFTQDSYYQVPLASPAWKLRIGLANSYNSTPPAGVKKMDTTYYTRLILDWQ